MGATFDARTHPQQMSAPQMSERNQVSRDYKTQGGGTLFTDEVKSALSPKSDEVRERASNCKIAGKGEKEIQVNERKSPSSKIRAVAIL